MMLPEDAAEMVEEEAEGTTLTAQRALTAMKKESHTLRDLHRWNGHKPKDAAAEVPTTSALPSDGTAGRDQAASQRTTASATAEERLKMSWARSSVISTS
jgi:hypothetical protein